MRTSLLNYLVLAHKIGDFTLTSGAKSDFYIDVKSLMFNAKALELLGVNIFKCINSRWSDTALAIGGMELGSVPLSAATVLRSCRVLDTPYSHFVVRKKAKGHGTNAAIEGIAELRKANTVILVDDVLTTGGSLIKTANTLAENGIHVTGGVVVVDRQESIKEKLPFDVYALFTKKDIIDRGK